MSKRRAWWRYGTALPMTLAIASCAAVPTPAPVQQPRPVAVAPAPTPLPPAPPARPWDQRQLAIASVIGSAVP